MDIEPRLTTQTLLLLRTLLERPADPRYGLELAEEADLKSGTLYPILARLERAGWLASEWENIDPARAGRPRRRLYLLTAQGEVAAREALEAYLARLSRPPAPRPGLRLRPGGQPT
jgi:DNA-binding PadR family transcriptional regulator